MNRWLQELKNYKLPKTTIKYYEQIIKENEFKNYQEICNEIGTPRGIYASENSENIEDTNYLNKEFISFNFMSSIRGIYLGIYDFIVSVLLFSAIFSPWAIWIEPYVTNNNGFRLVYNHYDESKFLINLLLISPIFLVSLGIIVCLKMYKLKFSIKNIAKILVVTILKFILSGILFTISCFSIGALVIYIGFITGRINEKLYNLKELKIIQFVDSF